MAIALHAHHIGGIGLVVGDGALDLSRAARFRRTIREAAEAGSGDVVVDLSQVTLIDAGIVGVLMQQRGRAEARNASLRAVAATGLVLEVLEVLGVAKALSAYDEPDSVPARPMVACCRPELDERASAQPVADRSEHGSFGFAEGALESLLAQAGALGPDDPHGRSLRQQVIDAARPGALRLARRYTGKGEQADDLNQVAALGLLKAVNGFDAERGHSFAAYAIPTILGELRRHFRDKGSVIKSPRWVQELGMNIRDASPALAQRLNREPTSTDLARELNQPAAAINEVMTAADGYRPTSLSSMSPDGGAELQDLIGSPDPGFDRVDDNHSLRRALASMPPRLNQILALRFYGNMTQSEIAHELGLSQMQISRLLRQAFVTLRNTLDQDQDGAVPQAG